MYQVKLIDISRVESGHWLTKIKEDGTPKYKTGDVVEVCNWQYRRLLRIGADVRVVKSYKIVTVSKKECPTCGQMIIKRKEKPQKSQSL